MAPMDAERVRQRVDGLTIVAPMDELGDVVVGQPSMVLQHRVCAASGDRASEHDRQKSHHCEERVAGFESRPIRSTRCQDHNVWTGQEFDRVSDRLGRFVFSFEPRLGSRPGLPCGSSSTRSRTWPSRDRQLASVTVPAVDDASAGASAE